MVQDRGGQTAQMPSLRTAVAAETQPLCAFPAHRRWDLPRVRYGGSYVRLGWQGAAAARLVCGQAGTRFRADITQGDGTLVSTCGFKEVFDQPRRAVWGHPNGFPISELCYVRADHNGYRWHNTWTDCQDKPDDPALLREVDDFYNSLIELPEFKNLSALRKTCRCYAEQPAEDDPNTCNLFAETPHFHVWLRLITRERDYNLYGHFFYKNWEEKE